MVNCLRELYTVNGDAAAEREARWTDAEAAVIETKPCEAVTRLAAGLAGVGRGKGRTAA